MIDVGQKRKGCFLILTGMAFAIIEQYNFIGTVIRKNTGSEHELYLLIKESKTIGSNHRLFEVSRLIQFHTHLVQHNALAQSLMQTKHYDF